jgi:drug/metabolite transporter (DMT)-like permease
MTIGIALRFLTAMVLWASCFPLITIGLNLAPHLAFATMRSSLAGISLIVLAIYLRRPFPQGARTWGLIVLVALGASSLGFFGMFHAAEFVSPGLATVIYNAQPLLAALLAHAVLRERLQALGKAGLLAGFVGIILIAWPGLARGGASGYALGITYVSLAAFGEAVGNVTMKRLPHEIDAIMAMGLQLLLGALPLGLLSLATEDVPSMTWSGDFLLLLVALSVFGTALPFWLWFATLKKVELNRANAFRFLIPLFGLAIGTAFFQERFGWIEAMGGALILAGIALVQIDSRGQTRVTQ